MDEKAPFPFQFSSLAGNLFVSAYSGREQSGGFQLGSHIPGTLTNPGQRWDNPSEWCSPVGVGGGGQSCHARIKVDAPEVSALGGGSGATFSITFIAAGGKDHGIRRASHFRMQPGPLFPQPQPSGLILFNPLYRSQPRPAGPIWDPLPFL